MWNAGVMNSLFSVYGRSTTYNINLFFVQIVLLLLFYKSQKQIYAIAPH